MRSHHLAAIALGLLTAGCATGGSGLRPSGSGARSTVPPPPDVDADCNPIEPTHSAACDRVRAEAADLDDQIAALRHSLDGPPRPTGPERANIMQSITELETRKRALGTQLASCEGRSRPRRQTTADVEAFLVQTGTDPAGTMIVSPVGVGLPDDGKLTQSLNPERQEFVLLFTESGCTVKVISVPTGKFKKTGVDRDFSLGAVDATKSGGKYHPVSGILDLHIATTLTPDVGTGDPFAFDLTTRSGGGRNVDAAGNVALVTPTPAALGARSNITLSIGVETVAIRFEGMLSPPPPR